MAFVLVLNPTRPSFLPSSAPLRSPPSCSPAISISRPRLQLLTRPHATTTSATASSSPISPAPPGGTDEPLSTPAGPVQKFQYVTWSQVEKLSAIIANAALNPSAKAPPFDVVLSITRGGMIPAALVCEIFGIRNVLSTTVMFYSDSREPFFGLTEPRFLSFPPPSLLEGRSVLVIDDVWDSGKTAIAVRERVVRANAASVKVGVLHFKEAHNRFPGRRPDFFGQITADWIVYPWETLGSQPADCPQDVDSAVSDSQASSDPSDPSPSHVSEPS